MNKPIVEVIADQIASKLQDLQSNLQPYLSDASTKSSRFSIKMALNKKVSQISQDTAQARKITFDILEIASSQCQTPDSQAFFMITLGEKLLEHGESLVSLHPASAFCLSWTAVEVGKIFPPFMDVLFGLFYQKSSWTIPRPPSNTALSAEQQCGIVYLFGAVLVTPFPDGRLIEYGWAWLATLLNGALGFGPDFSVILASFLEVSAWGMFQQWGRQFIKCLYYIQKQIIPNLSKEAVAGNTRLALIVDSMLANQGGGPGGIKMPEGAELVYSQ